MIATGRRRPRFNDGARYVISGLLRWGRAVILAMAGIAAPNLAWSNYVCVGQIDNVTVGPSGIVEVNSIQAGIQWVYPCKIDGTFNGVDPDTCKGIVSLLLAAHATGSQVQWDFNDSLTCTTHPQWTWLTGWYDGPVLY